MPLRRSSAVRSCPCSTAASSRSERSARTWTGVARPPRRPSSVAESRCRVHAERGVEFCCFVSRELLAKSFWVQTGLNSTKHVPKQRNTRNATQTLSNPQNPIRNRVSFTPISDPISSNISASVLSPPGESSLGGNWNFRPCNPSPQPTRQGCN